MKKLSLLFLLLSFSLTLAQLKKVEPAFWWKGMENTDLQILLYGPSIANQTLELSGGLKPKAVEKVENPNYLFVTIDTKEVLGDDFKITLKENGKVKSTYKYELKTRKEGSKMRKSYTSADVMYLIMPDRFANGDPSNDSQKDLIEKSNRNAPGGRHGGDLKGILNQLDYLENLGVSALWLTPVNQDNEKGYSYHGYAQTDLYKIDARYGSNEDYKKLSQELNKRGMMLVQDYVTNHWGISHWMIQDLPEQNWIHQFKDGEGRYGFKRSNYRITSQMDGNASEVDRNGALNGWFDTTMPDLNQANPRLLTYLTQNAIWWIEYAELGGLRVDTYPYNNKEAMAKWAKALTNEYPNLNIVGEAWMQSPAHISYWQKDSKVGEIDQYNSNLPSVMDFALYTELPSALKGPASWDKGMMQIYNSLSNDFLYPDVNNLLVFFENHDTERLNEIFGGDPAYYKLALSLISTVRGIPQIYYGSEIGMRGEKSKGDADIRRDFPGGWASDTQNAFTESTQTPEQKEYYAFTKKLLNWRKSAEVIHSGKTTHYMPTEEVYVYFRYTDNKKVMVVLNNNEKPVDLSLARFKESLEGIRSGKDVLSEKTFSISPDQTLTAPAKNALILELN
ncbi:glycoside hydrolase family 13 protein [Chryseobacterium sp. A321]